MTRCPFCFSTLSSDHAAWACTSPKCPPTLDDIATPIAGYIVENRTIMTYARPTERWNPPPSVLCTSCGDSAGQRVCPYCHFGPLPVDWMASNTTCIAMTGARDTGKSFYIAIAIKQLSLLGVKLGTTLDFADEHTKTTYRSVYELPLYEQRGIIKASPDVKTDNSYTRRPLIFSLGMIAGRRQYLVFRDIAGEELQREEVSSTDHLRFVANADCVFFMFDPVKVTTITDLLHDLIPEQTMVSGDPQVVLNNVLRLIGLGRPRLAVVLAKFDTMEELRRVKGTTWSTVMSNTGSAMLRDPSMSGTAYDNRDGELLDQEVRSLLLGLNADRLVSSLERPTNGNRLEHRYFAVSVLGESVRSEKVSTRGIQPFRCLDPLRWALASTGAM